MAPGSHLWRLERLASKTPAMGRVLILSSFVAASRVGGSAQALALARLGFEPVLVPTVVFGRHPGHGAPGGSATSPEAFASMLEAVEAQRIFAGLEAVITGYFASARQAEIAAATLRRVIAAAPGARIVVDPVMGDADKGLYVPEEVAQAIASELAPLAGVLTPNAWELGRLAGRPIDGPAAALAAARRMGCAVLVSSIEGEGRVGAIYAGPEGAWRASHPLRPSAPRGAGDLLTAFFTAALANGQPPDAALGSAVSAMAAAVDAAAGLDEFPIEALPTSLPEGPAPERLEGWDF